MLRFLSAIFGGLVILGLLGAGAGLYVLHHYGRGLSDYRQLADYEPPVTTRVHAADGRLMAEFAREKRVFVPIEAIPKRVIDAFLSAEDKTFYEHPGIDIPGVIAAVIKNVKNIGSSRRPVGASTITQQVAKNFLLTNEVSIERKIKEAILAFRIERAFSKDRILELYLNEIYLGVGSYGVATAALNYFDKSLDDLTLAEAAYLAALPKAPNNYHPTRRPDAARTRRDWVIRRLLEDGKVSEAEAKIAWTTPLETRARTQAQRIEAGYFTEEVRRQLLERYGEGQLYGGGLSVKTTLDPALQTFARDALRRGLEAYDRRRQPWRGSLGRAPEGADLTRPAGWLQVLRAFERPKWFAHHRLAVVTDLEKNRALLGLEDGTRGFIPIERLKWARKRIDEDTLAPRPRAASDVLSVGEIVAVEPVPADEREKGPNDAKDASKSDAPDVAEYGLRQKPQVQGAIVALDPHTGRVLAMVGGYSYKENQFNRVTQARRQPGSAFKPFVYLAALDSGYTPATRILDAPFVIDQGPGLPKWRPANYTREFYGPSTMRLGIEKSRNLMTVRLAQTIGMDKVADYARRFGISDNLQETLSMSLGAGETTLYRMTTAYAMLVNGGKRIEPTLIDRIQDRHGKTVFRHDARPCDGCQVAAWTGTEAVPEIPDTRARIADPASAYQVVSMLEGVVERGTGVRIGREVRKPLAGKTGTTNRSRDTWFVGFTPDLAVGVYVGFDEPKTLGRKSTGSSVAAPIFADFMKSALKDKPATPFRIPPNVRLVRVDAKSGVLAAAGDTSGVILEAFKEGTVPSGEGEILGAGQVWPEGDTTVQPLSGTGGLY